ncbi:uncharacterized protein LOC114315096 [Camellia sinensis]|uniref:uncharacterized protein LOC114315096 n=1 Tax=Camellia sinensis TaxID=4442 RepID=UPI001036121B|nr:uncharacterized protein LOC114315096 [Camellia sinensis]
MGSEPRSDSWSRDEASYSTAFIIEKAEGGGGERSLSEVLRMCCRRMDSKGLVRFLLAKRKESVALRAEIAAAAEESMDVMRLVLDTVEEFVEMKVEGKVGMVDKSDVGDIVDVC